MFLLDPNEGFGRNQRPAPLKSREAREAEDGGTYSDDDGARPEGGGVLVTRRGGAAAAAGVWRAAMRGARQLTGAVCMLLAAGPCCVPAASCWRRDCIARDRAHTEVPGRRGPSLCRPTEMRASTGKMRKSGKAAPKPLTATQKAVVEKLLAAHGEDVEVRALRGALWHMALPCACGCCARARDARGAGVLACMRTVPARFCGACDDSSCAAATHAAAVRAPLLQAWFRDIKLNRMQHSVAKLSGMLEAHRFYSAAGGAAAAHAFRGPRKAPKKIA